MIISTQAPAIRVAIPGDQQFIETQMQEALAPYYGGDHRAHARRIFTAHLDGGVDTIGHFSREQTMFVADVDDRPAGLIHVVGKLQGTYKISPLIVARDFRGHRGIGSALLGHADRYARKHGARQLYCTVAEDNMSALQFFLRKDFIVAGGSQSHFKDGIRELMLYKQLLSDRAVEALDEPNISVTPYEERHHVGVVELMRATVPRYFFGVDEIWIEATFRGYERRHDRDINKKYKLIYVATDRDHQVLGVVAATPKKGEPIKLMPLVAKTQQAFVALLTDLPALLMEFGHKLYTHMVPNIEQTIALQRFGWTLDAVFPGAYHDDHVTQQWSTTLNSEAFMRTMRVKDRFFKLIMSGQKDLEVRVGYDNIKTIQPGERILMTTFSHKGVVRVVDVRSYSGFDTMLKVEQPKRIAPDEHSDALLPLLKRIYPPDKERLGVIVLELKVER